MYQPSLLIVGTRGLSEFKGMLLGSVSKYCLQHSPVPVAVVRPEDKLKKSAKKISGLMRLGSANNVIGNTSEEDNEEPEKRFSKLSLKDSWQRSSRRSRSVSPN